MSFITIITIGFMVLEFFNVIAMYFMPEFKPANAVGVFKAWKMSKGNEDVHDLMKYLIRWVANSKLIFIALLAVILILGSPAVQVYSMLAMAASTFVFFISLFPLILKMDKKGQLTPKLYSIILFFEVLLITGAFVTAFVFGYIALPA